MQRTTFALLVTLPSKSRICTALDAQLRLTISTQHCGSECVLKGCLDLDLLDKCHPQRQQHSLPAGYRYICNSSMHGEALRLPNLDTSVCSSQLAALANTKGNWVPTDSDSRQTSSNDPHVAQTGPHVQYHTDFVSTHIVIWFCGFVTSLSTQSPKNCLST